MSKAWAVFKREYLEVVRKKSFIIMTLIFPFLMGGMMFVPALLAVRGIEGKRVVVVDGTGRLGEAFASGLDRRRLLQVAGRYPEVARVVVGQTRASADLLVRSYASMFRLPSALTRLVFEAILLLHQHQVLWGQAPPVVTGSLALRDLFAPVMADAP